MSKTGLSILTALVLVAVSFASVLTRRHVLGKDFDGPPSAGSWRVTMTVTGEFTAPDGSLTVTLPPDVRHQHIIDEPPASKELTPRSARAKTPETGERREVIWKPAAVAGKFPFRVTHSFRALMGMRRPTTAMAVQTRKLDSQPAAGEDLQPSARIESTDEQIRQAALSLIPNDSPTPVDLARSFFEFVRKLDTEPGFGRPVSARDCIRDLAGDSGGKSRLLVALCRNRGIPARLLTGLILVGDEDREQGLHYWVEAWVNDHWLPMCPVSGHFDVHRFPKSYLILKVGDDELIRCRGGQVSVGFVARNLRTSPDPDDPAEAADIRDEAKPPAPAGAGEASAGGAPPTKGKPAEREKPSALRQALRLLSLHDLRPSEQHLVKYLLLLPLGGLIVSVYRTVVGMPTYGTFGPALLGLVFVDSKALAWGFPIFIVVITIGWGLRHALEAFHLLQVPRTAALLTLVLSFLVVGVVVASHLGVVAIQYIGLFPLVILTHLIERFWTIEVEDGLAGSFKTLVGTLVVALTVSLVLAPEAVTAWMFRYPETLGLVLAAQFLLGRYTGYRLTELYRFGDLILDQSEPPPAVGAGAGSQNGLAGVPGEPHDGQPAAGSGGPPAGPAALPGSPGNPQ